MQVFLHVFKEEWHDEASLRYNYDLFRASDGGKSGSPTMLLGWDKEVFAHSYDSEQIYTFRFNKLILGLGC